MVVLSRYRGLISPSRAQYVADTTNGRLCLEHIIMYRPTSFSCNAMFISPRSRNQKMAAGSWSEESTLASEHPVACQVGLGSGLLVPDMGAPFGALEHEFWASGKEWVGVMVRAALANSVFGSPGSKPLWFVGEPGCEHSSPSRL